MMRRLFFLLPNNRQAGKLAVDLQHEAAIDQQDIHAVVHDNIHIDGINSVHNINESDRDALVEWWGWRINLGVFFIALIVFVVMMVWSPGYLLIVPALIMVGTYVAGLVFVLRLPTDHISDFISAVRHGEILMMVDVKISQVYDVGRYISRSHPEAITSGVCWHL